MAGDAKLYFRRGQTTGAIGAVSELAGVGNSLPVRGYPNGFARNGMWLIAKVPGTTTDATKTLAIALKDAADNGAGSPTLPFLAVPEGTTLNFTQLVTTQFKAARCTQSREWMATDNTVNAGANFGAASIYLGNEIAAYQ